MDLSEPLKAAVAVTLVQALTEEAKNKLLSDAVQKLIEPEKDNYGRVMPTTLQKIFREQVEFVAREVLRKEFEDGTETHAKLVEVVRAGVTTFLTDDGAKTKIADNIAKQMTAIIWETAKQY